MAREGVNYPGWFNQAACSIRCQLARLWSAVGSKVAKVNTIQPDGDGKINVVSDTANLIVTDDPSNNAIRLDLDAGLQAPPVTSVNGDTGAVTLDANDILDSFAIYNGSSLITAATSTKQAVALLSNGAKAGDDALRTRMTAAETAISTEASDRATADNAITASLPAAAAAAVAADPTVAQLTSDVTALQTADGNNVKLSGAQTITGNKSVSTQTTGQYSQQIANSQKVKNELDAYVPMVRTSGNQTIAGIKSFNAIRLSTSGIQATAAGSYAVCRITAGASQTYEITVTAALRSNMTMSKVTITTDSDSKVTSVVSTHIVATAPTLTDYIGAYTEDGYLYVYVRAPSINRYYAITILGFHGNYGYPIAPELINYTSVTPGNDAMDVTI